MSQQGNIVSRLWIGENVSGGNDLLFIFIQTSGILIYPVKETNINIKWPIKTVEIFG